MTRASIGKRGASGTTIGGIVRDRAPRLAVAAAARAVACPVRVGLGPEQAGHAAPAVRAYGEQSSMRACRRASDARRS